MFVQDADGQPGMPSQATGAGSSSGGVGCGVSVVDLAQAIDAVDPDDAGQVELVRDLAGKLATLAPDTVMGGRLDALEAVRQIKGQAEAAELLLLSRFVLPKQCDQFRPDGAAESEPKRVVRQDQALEVAMALQVSPFTIMRRIALAHQVVHDYPATHTALADGVFPVSSVKAIAAAGEPLDARRRRQLDRRIAAEARARGYTPRQVRAAVHAMVARLDPRAHERRTVVSRATRRSVWVTTLPHGVARLVATGKAEDVLAARSVLERQANTARAGGDARSRTTYMSDLLFDTLLGRDPQGPSQPPQPGGLAVELQVVVSAASLLGASHDPAHLVGYGAVPVELAEQLAAEHGAWIRQLISSPDDGHLTTSSRRRRFPAELGRFLTDQHGHQCAVNACDRQASDLDHVVDYADGGRTCRDNGQPLCWWCNQHKRHPDITAAKDPADDSVTWTYPSGRSYTQHPPPILGPGIGQAPLHRLFDRDLSHDPPPF